MQVPQQTTTWIDRDSDYENNLKIVLPFSNTTTNSTKDDGTFPPIGSSRSNRGHGFTTSGAGRDYELHVIELQTAEGQQGGPVHQDLELENRGTPPEEQQHPSSSTSVSSAERDPGRRKDPRNVGPLVEWLEMHQSNPYPSKSEKHQLAIDSQLSLRQLNDWFANARRNIKRYGYLEWRKKKNVTGFGRHQDKDANPCPNVIVTHASSFSEPSVKRGGRSALTTIASQRYDEEEEKREERQRRKKPRKSDVISYHPISSYYENPTIPSTLASLFPHHSTLPPFSGHHVGSHMTFPPYPFFTMTQPTYPHLTSKELINTSTHHQCTYQPHNMTTIQSPSLYQYSGGITGASTNNGSFLNDVNNGGILPPVSNHSWIDVSPSTSSSSPAVTTVPSLGYNNKTHQQYSNFIYSPNQTTPFTVYASPPPPPPPTTTTNQLVHYNNTTTEKNLQDGTGNTWGINGYNYSPLTPAISPLVSTINVGITGETNNDITCSQNHVYFEGSIIRTNP